MRVTPRSPRRRPPALGAALLLAGLAWYVAPARATTLRYQSVQELAASADAVVWASVTRVGTRMQRDAGRLQPEREAQLSVREVLLGEVRSPLAVQLRGGVHPGGARRVDGEASLREGEEVVLFLTRDGTRWRVLGMSLGVFRVSHPAGQPPRLVRRVGDAVVLGADGQRVPPVDETLTFPELRAGIARPRRSP